MTETTERGASEPHVKLVGPVVRGMNAELADALIAAIEEDNPDSEVQVEDRGGYIRISTPEFCRLTRASLEEALGHSFHLSEIEPALAGFAGRIKISDDEVVWYLERKD